MQARFRAKSLDASENGNPACENGFAPELLPIKSAKGLGKPPNIIIVKRCCAKRLNLSQGARRGLIAHRMGHNAFLADYETKPCQSAALIADSHMIKSGSAVSLAKPCQQSDKMIRLFDDMTVIALQKGNTGVNGGGQAHAACLSH